MKRFCFSFEHARSDLSGFTLLEIMIALAIIGMTLTVVIHTVNYHANVLHENIMTTEMYQVAKENENVLSEPESMVVFSQFGDNTLNFELRTYCPLTVLLATRHSMHREIDRLFREHNIEIAFPQRDLHIKSMPEALSKQIQQTAEQEYPA